MMKMRDDIYFDNFKASAGIKLFELPDLKLKSSPAIFCVQSSSSEAKFGGCMP